MPKSLFFGIMNEKEELKKLNLEKKEYLNINSIMELSTERVLGSSSRKIELIFFEKIHKNQICNFQKLDEQSGNLNWELPSEQLVFEQHNPCSDLDLSNTKEVKRVSEPKKQTKKIFYYKRKWTKEEDVKLLMLTNKMGLKWTKISKLMDNRSKSRCYERYTCLINRKKFIKRLPWTKIDLHLLALGSLAFKNNWVCLTKYFPKRNNWSVKQKYHNAIKSSWSYPSSRHLLFQISKNLSSNAPVMLLTDTDEELFFVERIALHLYFWKILPKSVKKSQGSVKKHQAYLDQFDFDLDEKKNEDETTLLKIKTNPKQKLLKDLKFIEISIEELENFVASAER